MTWHYPRGPLIDRFNRAKKTTNERGCILWGGNTNGRYGRLWDKGRLLRAHRAAWILFRGQIPDGMFVLHRCDTPLCVNVEHLFIGTHRDNVIDCVAKGRHPCLGENNSRAKLTWEKVDAIRAEAARGDVQRTIAKRYGIHESVVSMIVHHKAWRDHRRPSPRTFTEER